MSLIRLVAGALLLVVLVLGGAYVASQQQPGVANDLRPVPTSSAAARTFDEKIEAVSRAAAEAKRTGRAQLVEIAFTEEELTTKVARTAARQGAAEGITARDTQIHFSGTNIVAAATVTVSGLTVNLGVVAEPVVEDGRTKIVVKEIQTGMIPLPAAIREQLNAQIGSAIDPAMLGLPIDVIQLQVVAGRLVIKGTANP